MLASDDSSYYNILSIDGGGIRGIIPAKIIRKMEEFAYSYVTEKNYTTFKIYSDKKGEKIIAMKDLFDMMAGTSTGSILSTGLSYPKNDNKTNTCTKEPLYFANDLLAIYRDYASTIFKATKLNTIWVVVIWLVTVLICTLIGYKHGKNHFDNEEVLKSLHEFYDKAH